MNSAESMSEVPADRKLSASLTRRSLLKSLAALGIGSAVFHRALAAAAEVGPVTADMLQQAAWIAGIELKEVEQAAVAAAVEHDRRKIETLRQVEVGYDVPPAMAFFAAPPQASD